MLVIYHFYFHNLFFTYATFFYFQLFFYFHNVFFLLLTFFYFHKFFFYFQLSFLLPQTLFTSNFLVTFTNLFFTSNFIFSSTNFFYISLWDLSVPFLFQIYHTPTLFVISTNFFLLPTLFVVPQFFFYYSLWDLSVPFFIPNLPHSYAFHATLFFQIWGFTVGVLTGSLKFLPMDHLQKLLFHQDNGQTSKRSFKGHAHSLAHIRLYVMESDALPMYHSIIEKIN